jgi:GTP-binding protein
MSNFLKIAIIGRTNVGKTTFFNKFCNQKLGIVSDFSGLTRDINHFKTTIQNCNFEIFDTPGFEKDSIFFKKIQKQYFTLIENCDLVMFFSDGKAGFLDEDRLNLAKIKKFLSKTILIINKCENEKKLEKESFNNLPFQKTFKISSEHLNGFKELYSFLSEFYTSQGFELNLEEPKEKKRKREKAIIREIESKKNAETLDENKENQEEESIRIAVIGRPNVGKSTFLNKILKEDRLCVSNIAGTTRDSIKIPFQYQKHGSTFNF